MYIMKIQGENMNTDIGTDRYVISDDNKITGTHLATGYSVEILLTNQEMVLATSKSETLNDEWNAMCFLVHRRTGQNILGEIQIDSITQNGNTKDFH